MDQKRAANISAQRLKGTLLVSGHFGRVWASMKSINETEVQRMSYFTRRINDKTYHQQSHMCQWQPEHEPAGAGALCRVPFVVLSPFGPSDRLEKRSNASRARKVEDHLVCRETRLRDFQQQCI